MLGGAPVAARDARVMALHQPALAPMALVAERSEQPQEQAQLQQVEQPLRQAVELETLLKERDACGVRPCCCGSSF